MARNEALKVRVRGKYGDACVCCGRKQGEVNLQLDHVSGYDGTGPRSGDALWREADRNPKSPALQLLCSDCNSQKTATGWCRLHERLLKQRVHTHRHPTLFRDGAEMSELEARIHRKVADMYRNPKGAYAQLQHRDDRSLTSEEYFFKQAPRSLGEAALYLVQHGARHFGSSVTDAIHKALEPLLPAMIAGMDAKADYCEREAALGWETLPGRSCPDCETTPEELLRLLRGKG